MSIGPIVTGLLLLILAVTQAGIWLGEGRVSEVQQLRSEVESLQQKNSALRAVVQALQRQVDALKAEDLHEIQGVARSELGMVGANELFVKVAP